MCTRNENALNVYEYFAYVTSRPTIIGGMHPLYHDITHDSRLYRAIIGEHRKSIISIATVRVLGHPPTCPPLPPPRRNHNLARDAAAISLAGALTHERIASNSLRKQSFPACGKQNTERRARPAGPSD